jgi:hypothetical protein
VADGNKDITQEEQVRPVFLRVPPSLHKSVKQFALDRDMTAQEVWIAAVRKYIKASSTTRAA